MPQDRASAPPVSDYPFAIRPEHVAERVGSWRTRIAVAVLGATILAAFSGLLGGGPQRELSARGGGLEAQLAYDPIVRSGNWFETTLTVRAGRPVTDLTVAVDQALWRRMSIDTIAPDAQSAEGLDGRYTYRFGEVKQGETFHLKFDGQIQAGMLRRQTGRITILDGDRELLAMPTVTLTVLP